MGNKPATTTTTQSQSRSPWAPAVKPLKEIISGASSLAGNVSNFTPIYSDLTNQGIQTLASAGMNGSAAQDALGQVVPGSTAGFNTGLGQLQSVASGQMLNANQYLDPVLKAAMDETASKVNSQFTAAGRYGSGAHTGALTSALGTLENQARLANYNTERGAQDTAAKTLYGGGFQGGALGTTLDQASLFPAQTQLAAGSLMDQQANAKRLAPMQALEWQAGITNPIANMGGTSNSTGTSQTVQPTNPLTQALGVAQMGLGLLSAPMTGGASLMGTAAAPSLLGGLTNYFGGSSQPTG